MTIQPHTPQISTELWTCERVDSEDLHEVRCAECGRCGLDNKFTREELEEFVADVLAHHGVPRVEAETVGRVLVAADLRGISSHGVARLGRYLNGIEKGTIRPGVEFVVTESAPAVGAVDARHGLGQVAGEYAMKLALDKAASQGVGAVTVKNSNHYGIAGFYAKMAIDQGMLGVSMTNSAPLVIPTHGADAMLGTNPIALGVPSAVGRPFLLDMATSVVPRGKLEVHDRNRQQLPTGWAVDEKGFDCQNPGQVLGNLLERAGGGILPLGGRGELFGGYKGFGLAMLVDMLSGVLSGSAFGADVNNLERDLPEGEIQAPRVGHFFLAIDPSRFLPAEELAARADAFAEMVRGSRKALDQERIYIHGEKEQIRAELHERGGIPVADNVLDTLRRIAAACGVEPPRPVADVVDRVTPTRATPAEVDGGE